MRCRGLHLFVFVKQPQHGMWHLVQDAQPCIKHLGADFEGAVETAQYKGVVGQSGLCATDAGAGDGTVGVVGLVAAGQSYHVLGVKRFVPRGDDVGVADHVVHPG